MTTIKYDEATIFNANIEKLCPKWVDVTFETSGSPSCWTNYGSTRHSGAHWGSLLDNIREDCEEQECLKEVSGPYGSDYFCEVVLTF